MRDQIYLWIENYYFSARTFCGFFRMNWKESDWSFWKYTARKISNFYFFTSLHSHSSKCSLFIQELRKTWLETSNSSNSVWMLLIFRNVALGCFQHDDWLKKLKSLLFPSFSKPLSKINCSTWNYASGVLVLFSY